MSPFPRVLACAVLGLSLVAATVRADEPGFTAKLSTADQTAAGLTTFTPEQLSALDLQIAREITVARQGDVVAFSRSFMQRRNADQLANAGLSALNTEERTQLDTLVARAVAQRPPILIKTLAAKAKEQEAVETITYKPQIHGEVSLTYGMGSGGRNFYGGSFTGIYEDPAHHLTVGFTYAEYHGKGLLPFYDDFGPGVGVGVEAGPRLR
jgi:hypothetical protein